MLKTWYPRIHWFTILLSMQNAIFRRTLSCSSLHEAANPRLGVEGKSTANPLRGSTSWQTSTQKSCRWCSRRLAAPSDIIRYIINIYMYIYIWWAYIYIYTQYIYIYTKHLNFFLKIYWICQEDRLGAVYSWGLVAADGRLGYVDDEAMTGAADVMLICG